MELVNIFLHMILTLTENQTMDLLHSTQELKPLLHSDSRNMTAENIVFQSIAH